MSMGVMTSDHFMTTDQCSVSALLLWAEFVAFKLTL